jgi:hypothetical protein
MLVVELVLVTEHGLDYVMGNVLDQADLVTKMGHELVQQLVT